GIGQHAQAQRLDELPEALAGAGVAALAPQRDGDDLRARGLDSALENGRRWIARRAQQQARGKLYAVEHGQPPCMGATTSIRSPSASLVAGRAAAATKRPFTAVAILRPANPSESRAAARVAASTSCASSLRKIRMVGLRWKHRQS